MSDETVAPQTRGVTVELLATVDLGPEIAGMRGRQLRMRMVTIEPGGVFGPVHDHRGRPGTVYVLRGTITDHRAGTTTDYGPGVGWPEDRNTLHWLENRGYGAGRGDLGRCRRHGVGQPALPLRWSYGFFRRARRSVAPPAAPRRSPRVGRRRVGRSRRRWRRRAARAWSRRTPGTDPRRTD